MMDDHTQKALATWYSPDDPLHLDPRYPLIKLAGEAGELLDLFGKNEYKPGFSWTHCVCGFRNCICENRVPKVLDELGDWYYYYRIVSYIYGRPLRRKEDYYFWDIDRLLAVMTQNSAVMLNDWLDRKWIDGSRLEVLWGCFAALLDKLGCTLDHLAELNYQKLNSEPTAHGWKK